MSNLAFWAFGFWMPIIIIAIIWSIFWKGLALWKSAQRGDAIWFIIFLIINTLGILEILYLYIFSKKNKEGQIGNAPKK